ncbi:MAG: hypothetical protein B6D61_04120 [Bacteroidetes bacterium 4484_249]|nr:MAG: hypothetical protein B6D61_04120 [Bacteroidetes bacterium 4484_249]
MTTKLIQLFFLIFVTLNISAQKKYPQNYFIPPIDNSIYLSGTFGELRSNHFHSGIDIRTGEVEGWKVYAIADGYVSRIKVSPGGYGQALYITHPNGFVSVFGHLKQYNKTIGEYVKNEQYKRQSYAVDLYPEKDLLTVKKGEVVALTGNTGRSGGPHLHFEIRDEASQKPINPLLFGVKVKDNTPPVINLLKIYQANPNTLIENKNTNREYFTKNNGNYYVLQNKDTIKIDGEVYFGINTYDPFNNGNNKNGVYSIKLFLDSNLIYEHNVESFSFAETRYINSLIDYKEYKLKKRRVQKSYVQPNNRLSIYKKAVNNGIVKINDNSVHSVSYEISDVAGNTSKLNFHIINNNKSKEFSAIKNQGKNHRKLFDYKTNNLFKTENLILQVPGEALYDTLYFSYRLLPALNNSYSEVHQLHYDYVPLQKWCSLSIKPDSIPEKLQSKALIAKIDKAGEFSSEGGKWERGFIKTKIREFGKYCILIDTIAPLIKPVNIYNGKNIAKQNTIKVKITDKLSGIKSYRGTLNGNWILMEYDAKYDLLIYRFDDLLLKGENIFELKAEDNRNNISKYNALLIN